MSKCDERFARQYRYEPPPGFPLASPCSDIVHHLSGPNKCAQLKPLSEDRGRSPVLKSRQILSFRIQVWYSHTRTCVWTPWSVFQDGSYDALQAYVMRRADQPGKPCERHASMLAGAPIPAPTDGEDSRPVQRCAQSRRLTAEPRRTRAARVVTLHAATLALRRRC